MYSTFLLYGKLFGFEVRQYADEPQWCFKPYSRYRFASVRLLLRRGTR